jgi:hypothetical protein
VFAEGQASDYSSGVATFAPVVSQLTGHHAALHEEPAHFVTPRTPQRGPMIEVSPATDESSLAR